VADPDVQTIRAGKRVPNGRSLHEYANTYFDARNPMMYRRLGQCDSLAVIRISPDILDTPGSVIADGNAASSGTRFDPSPAGLARLDEENVYAEYWTDPDPWVQIEKKRQRCAEVLVPDMVPPELLIGCYVVRDDARKACHAVAADLSVEVHGRVFFR
jgi:hypothetical protein